MVRLLTFLLRFDTNLVTAKLVCQAAYFLSDSGLLFLKLEEQDKTGEMSGGDSWSIFAGTHLFPYRVELISRLCIEAVHERVRKS